MRRAADCACVSHARINERTKIARLEKPRNVEQVFPLEPGQKNAEVLLSSDVSCARGNLPSSEAVLRASCNFRTRPNSRFPARVAGMHIGLSFVHTLSIMSRLNRAFRVSCSN